MGRIELLSKDKLIRLSSEVRSTVETYDEWRDYDSDLVEVMEYKGPSLMAKHLLPYIKDGCNILDVGCGTGLNGVFYKAKKNCVITGIDISGESLKRASTKKFNGRKVYAQLKQVNLEKKLDFEDNVFDVVLCVGVFEYFKKIETVVGEMSRISKDIVAFNVPTTKPPYLNQHSRREVMKILDKFNLELLDEFRAHTWTTIYGRGKKRIFARGIISKHR